MKRSDRIAIFLTALALLFVSIPGFSKSVSNASKPAAKHKRIKHSTRPAPQRNSDQTYIIRRGDSLLKIARANQTTPEALKSANGLKNTRITAGQTLLIPASHKSASKNETPKKETPQSASVNRSMTEESAIRYISQLKDQDPNPDEESPSTRLRLVEAGFRMIGIRYRPSGGSEKTGFDCSGLVKNLFSKFDIDLPRSSSEQYKQGEKVDRDKLEIGDLVFFSSGGSRPTHVGIYVGNDKILHAARKARQVVVSDLNKIWFTVRYLGARRISDLWGDKTNSDPGKE